MTTENLSTIPLDNLTPEQVLLVAQSYLISMTADFTEYPLDIHHPVWQRYREFRRIFTPNCTDEDIARIFMHSCRQEPEVTFVNNIPMEQFFMECLGLTAALPQHENQEE